jgi:glycosyltransferase involved in cell wall biosynthesis
LYYFLARHLAEQPAARRAAGLLAVSEATRNEFTEHYSIPVKKISLNRHGLDTQFFSPAQNREKLREEFGFDPKDLVILFVSFITPRKGLEFLVHAYPKLQPRPKLLIIGKWRDEGYHQQIRSTLEKFTSSIVELGYVSDDQMPLYYSLADVYVSPSLMEGFGLPLGEALACETPVVAFDVGATAEVVGPGGILVPPRDVDGLANAINYLLQNPDVRQAMGKEGRQHILREFSVKAMLSSTLEAYQRFLGISG